MQWHRRVCASARSPVRPPGNPVLAPLRDKYAQLPHNYARAFFRCASACGSAGVHHHLRQPRAAHRQPSTVRYRLRHPFHHLCAHGNGHCPSAIARSHHNKFLSHNAHRRVHTFSAVCYPTRSRCYQVNGRCATSAANAQAHSPRAFGQAPFTPRQRHQASSQYPFAPPPSSSASVQLPCASLHSKFPPVQQRFQHQQQRAATSNGPLASPHRPSQPPQRASRSV